MGIRGFLYMLFYLFQGIYGFYDILGDIFKELCDFFQVGERVRMNGMKKEDEVERTSKVEGERIELKSVDIDLDKLDDDEGDKQGYIVFIKKESFLLFDGEKIFDIGDILYLFNRNVVYVLFYQYSQYKNGQDVDEEFRELCDLLNFYKFS